MTQYNPKMCVEIIEMAELGRSLTQIAAYWHVTEEDVISWTQDPDKSDFKQALEVARVCSEAYYEDLGQKGMKGKIPDFKSTVWAQLMKARFKKNWADCNIQKIEIKNDIKNMSIEEIDQNIEALIAQREVNKKNNPNKSGCPTSP